MNALEEKYKYYEKIKEAIHYVDENFSYQPKLDEIASHIGLSKHHFSRTFKEYVGVTPMQFLQATTISHAKEHLKTSKSILDTSYDLGLSSLSRLHELFVNFVGVTPNEYKKMGDNLHITYGFANTPFGKAMIANTSKGICALEFYDENADEVLLRLKQTWNKAEFIHDDIKAQMLINEIFLENKKVNLFVKGTNFQINVWKALLNIPKGELSTYSDIAKIIDRPKAVRAVASAIGSNHIGFLIPCHRVISKTAAMGGYRWGIPRKRVLISYEYNLKNN